jgi:hypothetical protein
MLEVEALEVLVLPVMEQILLLEVLEVLEVELLAVVVKLLVTMQLTL